MLKKSINIVESTILKNHYRGYDRYDGLHSPIFKIPFLNQQKFRFYFQQITKRLPGNFRPLLAIPKGYNPVTLGLCLQGFAYLSQVDSEEKDDYLARIDHLIGELVKLQSVRKVQGQSGPQELERKRLAERKTRRSRRDAFEPGNEDRRSRRDALEQESAGSDYSGACWGYDFDWEARYASLPAYTPTVVATGIITNALFAVWELTQNQSALDLCISAAKFVRNDLNKVYDGDLFCYSYSPFDKQVVFNATMKGARLLAQVYSVTGDVSLKDEAEKTVRFVMQHQNANGAWVYSHKDDRNWVDNYHTGYILDCLDAYIKLTGDKTFSEQMQRGFRYYRDNFFEKGRIPKFYDKKTYPVDCTSAAQSILTLVCFGELDTAQKVAEWMIDNMQGKDGHFYFRKYKYFTSKVSFMRWSNAWMFAGLAYLLFRREGS